MRCFTRKYYSASRLICMLAIVLMLGGCAPGPRIYSSAGLSLLNMASLALLPFDNLSGESGASKQVYDIFLVEFLKVGRFSVVDPGEVERILADERIRFTAELSREQITKVGNEVGATILVQGVILEYGIRQIHGFNMVEVPYLSIMVKMVDTKTGEILWASSYSRNGNDTEKVFGIGRVTSLNRLAELMAAEMVESLGEVVYQGMEI